LTYSFRALAVLMSLMGFSLDLLADSKTEQSIYNDYKKYAEEPTSEEVWQKLAEGLSDRSYTVQKGDTLWEISKVFFADPYFWPKIWALNKDIIFNPHMISPGDLLIFDLGSVERPPSVTLIQDGATGVDSPNQPENKEGSSNLAQEDAVSSEEASKALQNNPLIDEDGFISPIREYMSKTTPKSETVKLPPAGELPSMPPELKRRDVIGLPESLPKWSGRPDPQSLITTDFKSPERTPGNIYQQLRCWIDETSLADLGRVVEVEGGMHAAHENQYVFVQSNSIQIGTVYSVVRKIESKISGNPYIYEKQGDLQIIEKSSSTEPIYRALVLSAFSPIEVESQVTAQVISEFMISENEPLSQVNATIVAGFCQDDRHIFGDGEVIFLKSQQGELRVGQHLPIFRNEKIRNIRSNIDLKPRLIGRVQVLKVSGEWVTGTVVNATEELMTGDGTSPTYVK